MKSLNFHRLLMGTTTRNGYLDAITVRPAEEAVLRGARDLIRETLRVAMRGAQDHVMASGLIEQRYIALASKLPPLRPKFRMQGSAKYRTLNDPAQQPPQKVDYDDGVYLPTSFVSADGRAHPVVAAKGYFSFVERALQPLCDKMGWELDRSKPNCVRIKINSRAHIDLPLYAIPDNEFSRLAEDHAAGLSKSMAAADSVGDEFSEAVYKRLPADKIVLARRNLGWIESDPRKIEDWFLVAIDDHGESLRRVCRYIKAWRDFQWGRSSLCSLALMACVVQAYDDLRGTVSEDRDDLTLLAITRKLPDLLAREIPNPVLPDQRLDDGWTIEERATVVAAAKRLYAAVESACNRMLDKAMVISRLRSVLGDRVPNDSDLIILDGIQAEVLSYRPAAVAAPIVPRTTSG